jgi:hypothetical protein
MKIPIRQPQSLYLTSKVPGGMLEFTQQVGMWIKANINIGIVSCKNVEFKYLWIPILDDAKVEYELKKVWISGVLNEFIDNYALRVCVWIYAYTLVTVFEIWLWWYLNLIHLEITKTPIYMYHSQAKCEYNRIIKYVDIEWYNEKWLTLN